MHFVNKWTQTKKNNTFLVFLKASGVFFKIYCNSIVQYFISEIMELGIMKLEQNFDF